MKKILIAILVVVVAALAVTGAASAQESQPFTPNCVRGSMPVNGQTGLLHEYFVSAYAQALGLSVDELETRLTGGETIYQVALAQGFPADQIPALLAQARTQAINAAVADGTLTQTQADWMLQHQFQRGAGNGTGMMGNSSTGGASGMGLAQGLRDGTGVPTGSGQRGPGRMGSGGMHRQQPNP